MHRLSHVIGHSPFLVHVRDAPRRVAVPRARSQLTKVPAPARYAWNVPQVSFSLGLAALMVVFPPRPSATAGQPAHAGPERQVPSHWPQWRGPSSAGVSTEAGLPTTWSPTENLAWKVALDGLGASSPIVWGDRVIVTSQVGRTPVAGGSHPLLARDDR